MSGSRFDAMHSIFYDNEWSPEMEQEFISILEDDAIDGVLKLPVLYKPSLERAHTKLQTQFGVCISIDNLATRLRKLCFWSKVFNKLVGMPGVRWNRCLNAMRIPDNVWDALIHTCPIARAYAFRGEPHYEFLCIILGKVPEDFSFPEFNINSIFQFPSVHITPEESEGQTPSPNAMCTRTINMNEHESPSVEEIAEEEFVSVPRSRNKGKTKKKLYFGHIPGSPAETAASSNVFHKGAFLGPNWFPRSPDF